MLVVVAQIHKRNIISWKRDFWFDLRDTRSAEWLTQGGMKKEEIDEDEDDEDETRRPGTI